MGILISVSDGCDVMVLNLRSVAMGSNQIVSQILSLLSCFLSGSFLIPTEMKLEHFTGLLVL